MTTSSPRQFLQEELAYAERHLARLRRIAQAMEDDLVGQGLTEAAVYEKLAANKAYRQLHRDQAVFQQMWIRCHRHLLRVPEEVKMTQINLRELHQQMEAESAAEKPQPYRKPPTPTRNQPCSCGSGIKYKRCCGNPLRQQPQAA